MLFTPATPLRTVQSVPGQDLRCLDVPPVTEVVAGNSIRLNCAGGAALCGPVGVVGAEPGDLVMVEVLAVGRAGRGAATGAHPGILICGDAEPIGDECRALTPRAQVLLPVRVPGARICAGDLHFPDEGHCRTRNGWLDLRIHLTKRGMDRFRVTEPVVMPRTTSSLDATVAGLTAEVA